MKNNSQISYNIKSRTIKITSISLLCTVSIILSILDDLIPVFPFLPPGAKLGLSNIATMFASAQIGLGISLIIAVIKSLFVGITRGTTAFLMSFFAGIISTFITGFLLRTTKKHFSFIGIGIIGAITHNIAQLIVAISITCTTSLIYYLPVIIIFAIITGILTGIALKTIIPALEKIKF